MSTIGPVSRAGSGAQSDRRRWIVSAALFAPLLLLLVVAARTWEAEKRYAAVTHRVIHDYSAIAAWQYARRANTALHNEAMAAFKGIAPGHQRTGSVHSMIPPGAILAPTTGNGGVFLRNARFAFSYDAASGRLETAGSDVDAEAREMLQRRLTSLAPTTDGSNEPHRVLFDSSGGNAHAIALWTISSPDRPLRAAYGVVADPRELRARLTRLISEAPLLPATSGAANIGEADIAVRLSRQDGATVFATPQPLGSTAATDSTGLQWGELRTTVDLSPQLVNALLVGGAPPSQMPSLLLMILGAFALAVLGLLHERRSRELARLRGRFVANVSHELRTPLSQISMFAETLALRRERSAGEGREFAAIILAEARRLTALVESVLRFSRIESGRETLRVESASVAGEISDAVEAFSPIARAADVTIQTHFADDPQARLDRAAFRQIVLNLLDNAVKHGGHGSLVHVSTARDGGNVRVTVDDSGPGVPPDWRERVFEPFVRLEGGNAAGAGIGLAVVRDLVVAHGGAVWIDESPRGGARFVVTVPAERFSAPTVPPATAEQHA